MLSANKSKQIPNIMTTTICRADDKTMKKAYLYKSYFSSLSIALHKAPAAFADNLSIT